MLQYQKHGLKLPLLPLVDDPTWLTEVHVIELEQQVTLAYKTQEFWLLPRAPFLSNGSQPLQPRNGQKLKDILSIDILLDRWLLCVYAEGIIYLWDLVPSENDTDPSHTTPRKLCATIDRTQAEMRGQLWRSCVTTADIDGKSILLVCMTHASAHMYVNTQEWLLHQCSQTDIA